MSHAPSMLTVNLRWTLSLCLLTTAFLAACGGGDGQEPAGPTGATGQLTDPAAVPSTLPITGDMTFVIRDNGVSAPSGVSTTIAGGSTPVSSSGQVYVIKPGDLCFTIAETMGVSVDALLDSNPGTDCNTLQPGTELRVPAGGSGGSTPTPEATTTAGNDATPTPADGGEGGEEYTIQPGDICVDIADSFGVNVDELVAANNLDCSNLTVGEVISIP